MAVQIEGVCSVGIRVTLLIPHGLGHDRREEKKTGTFFHTPGTWSVLQRGSEPRVSPLPWCSSWFRVAWSGPGTGPAFPAGFASHRHCLFPICQPLKTQQLPVTECCPPPQRLNWCLWPTTPPLSACLTHAAHVLRTSPAGCHGEAASRCWQRQHHGGRRQHAEVAAAQPQPDHVGPGPQQLPKEREAQPRGDCVRGWAPRTAPRLPLRA